MTDFQDDSSRISQGNYAKRLAQSQKNAQSNSKKPENEALASPRPRDPDLVEISGTMPAAVNSPNQAKPDVTAQEMQRYTDLLKDMPDVRQEEIDRVQAVLADEGYGPEAISAIVDQLLEE